jgi:serine/threonine protein kinase
MDRRIRLLFHELVDLAPADRQRVMTQRQIAPEVRAELESLLNFDSTGAINLTVCVSGEAQEILRTVSGRDVNCGAYRLIRLLGQGGMGSVYLGTRQDGEIQQTVAIKLLNAGEHRPAWRDRFLKERQLLASLNHPSIVHVLDAGRTADGQPYLVMEYVEGVALDVYAAAIDLRESLLLFLRICEGVSHAHRRLVIHRDLKPSNILVDASGQPKLLDFGLARLLDETGDATQTVERMLTPNYASPEQLRGVSQTTATDVYSLGAILYKILTGRSPHESDTRVSQIAGVIAGDRAIAAPSRLNPKLSSDLDYIVRRALRTEPEDRYASVDAFADDIRSFLESRPIEARSGDGWYRTRKLLRRHWVRVVASMVVIGSLSAGLYIANRERLVAERRFAQLRRLSNKVFDLDKTIRDLPGSTPARQSIVSDSLEYLTGLAEAARGDLDLAFEIGQGYWRVGRIQGVPSEFNLGETVEAEANLKTAAEFIDRVLASRPRERNALNLSGIIAGDRMVLAQREHRYADALTHAHRAAEQMEAFLRLGDASQTDLAQVAERFGNIALVQVNMHLYEEAIPYARREVELAESVPAARIPVDAGLIAYADAWRRADLEGVFQALEEGRKAAEKAVFPSERQHNGELYGILSREGRILGGDGEVNLGRPGDASRALQQALDLAEETAHEDPKDATSRSRAAETAIALGDILYHRDILRHRDSRQALVVYDLALRRLSEIRISVPTQRDQALGLASSSYPLGSLGRAPEARQRIEEAFAILKNTGDYPADRYYLDSAAYTVICALADYEDATGNPRRAIETYEQLLQKVLPANGSAPPDFEDSPRLSRIYEHLADLYRRTGDEPQAQRMRTRRVELWQHWERKFPSNAFIRRQLEAASF